MEKAQKDHSLSVIGYQAVFWTALFFFGLAQAYSHNGDESLKEIILYNLCHLLFEIVTANMIYYFLVRHFFDRKRYVLFIINTLIAVYLFSVLNRIFIVYAAEPFFSSEPQDSLGAIITDLNYLLTHYAFPIITISFIFICFMHILRYKNEKQDRIRLQKEKAELELKVLKSSLNPHFLFNTLNNIYSLSLNHPEDTPESIAGLADIFDYVIYKGPQKLIRITDEMAVIERYMELEKLRYGSNFHIEKAVNVSTENMIPPLLYLSLVENAFKHGGNAKGGLNISLELHADEMESVLRVQNSCFGERHDTEAGIGLKNIEEQLKLYYQNNFQLNIREDPKYFSVEMITPAKL
ncbi:MULTISPECIES: sensor histidine kinase [Chryseobacterium]|uniref:Two-component system sensor histidine kinase AlgZ n=1 Tax=Chryseobacterium camelliae TaxID=1265445 RepID=A0ABU0TJE1_9FLAO|nr:MULTISPECIES: sensor histidine kinase [Chryseobacterium]MDT3408969.1 two-component system sensor histidine kinase AlgZ [Pseudacidovorax intermedius]MDQ1097174.1 two-component system sensor histidine kinase AlgZ [Chryseobacterium camelliae]MDQ1101111.1 two-component system sensor histidine kinase AlgZ [Chryseobacterium sp. SORGH_AS_1048]MDR6084554.1 two-component system sensor histidine kinase AlgZ [Chryseobacterium sp. SORGH_AS_0909]MDR6132823.1 two-component system sensor histidine kinase 